MCSSTNKSQVNLKMKISRTLGQATQLPPHVIANCQVHALLLIWLAFWRYKTIELHLHFESSPNNTDNIYIYWRSYPINTLNSIHIKEIIFYKQTLLHYCTYPIVQNKKKLPPYGVSTEHLGIKVRLEMGQDMAAAFLVFWQELHKYHTKALKSIQFNILAHTKLHHNIFIFIYMKIERKKIVIIVKIKLTVDG